jgi:hypothetical protein
VLKLQTKSSKNFVRSIYQGNTSNLHFIIHLYQEWLVFKGCRVPIFQEILRKSDINI